MIKKLKKILKEKLISKYEIPNVETSLFHLNKYGFKPKNIFDVGAYKGDFALLANKIWSHSKIVCFEPLSKQITFLKELEKQHNNIKVIEGVVGDKKKEIEFNEAETASSCLSEQIEQGFPKTIKQMNTLSNYIREYNLESPNLLKIDTQGYEYQVLLGCTDFIAEIDVILAELNFLDIHKNVFLAADVIKFLDENDFVIYDIAEIHRRPFDNAIWQTDFIFIKKDSFLRSEKKWK